MWLLPLFSPLARAASAVYYRVRYAGPAVPAEGPALLVANHPNSLFDPTLVIAAAGRRVRFLAKAPLFADRTIGWLMRGTGAIPVYRKSDDPALMAQNEGAFQAAYEVLGGGAAVGIFPEGISHSEPGIAPLKTGAARIALGAALRTGGAFSIIPIGLSFREKDVFRSDAYVVRGTPIAWNDLADRGPEDTEAVRDLTARIDAALRAVTVNLHAWEDRPLVECAVRIWEAERGTRSRDADRVARLDTTARLLARVRDTNDPAGLALADEVRRHNRRLTRLRLRPSDLAADVGAARGIRWAARRLHLLLPFGIVLATLGAALFWVPYQLTGIVVRRFPLQRDVRATWKLMIGTVLYAAWLAMLVTLAWITTGWVAALITLFAVPAVAITGLVVRERWRAAWDDARRFFLLRSRRSLIEKLRSEQRSLATRLEALL